MRTTRREIIGAAAVAAVGWRTFGLPGPAGGAAPGYGPLGPADANGVCLPAGFTARLLGRTGRPVAGPSYRWHAEPDGAATFAMPDGGWALACNSEDNGNSGGASAIRFDAGGEPVSAYRILSGTKWNCAGGATPWGTWLSCEEFRNGLVWECDPSKPGQGIPRKALGRADARGGAATDRVWALDLASQRISVIYDGQGANATDALHDPDNVTVHERTGDAFVAEDADDIQLVQLVRSGSSWTAVPFLQFAGHDGSEVTGPAFSPDGSRLYVNSQRGFDGDGMTFEITGPFA